jgi:acetolactate synthase I/II/III large subunit
MKLSDVVAQFLAEQGIGHVFAISGGASLHLIHSIAEAKGTTYVCPQHEQAGAYAADGYARVTGKLGCAVATSGPGATNLITGICSSYYDSVPVLYLTGQVATFRAKGDTGVRQIGFQETDMVDICRSITKYAVLVTDPYRVRYELKKAVEIARSGRPGPVLVDIPDDLQRMDIDPSKLLEYQPEKQVDIEPIAETLLDACIEAVQAARRPVLVYGWGVHLAKAENEARELARILGVPVAMTWAALDLLPNDDPLAIGGFGTHGTRFANFAVQNADLIIAIGSRLDTKATGSPASSFAREAKLFMLDIDPSEIRKFERLKRKIDCEIVADAGAFLRSLIDRARGTRFPDFSAWCQRIATWKATYPQCLPDYEKQEKVNPYWLVKQLSRILQKDEIVVSDTGCAVAWLMQGMEFKTGQRFFHAFNNTPMGYALPASIGACFARPGQRIICAAGDGGLQMSIQEMATAAYHRLPVKILLLNNRGHGMVRQTQQMWLEGKYFATSPGGGLPTPDFTAIAGAYGLHCDTLSRNADVAPKLEHFLNSEGPALLNVELDPDEQVIPQVKYGRPNEDGHPLLGREEFMSNMIVPPMAVSLSSN